MAGGLESRHFCDGSVGKEFTCSAGNTGDVGLIPGLARSPGEGTDNPLQYSCLKNPTDRRLAGYNPKGCKESDTTKCFWKAEVKQQPLFSCRKVGVGAAALSFHEHCCSPTGMACLAWRQLPSLHLPLASLTAGWDTRSSTMKGASFYCGALVSCKLEAMRDQSRSTQSWWVPAHLHFFSLPPALSSFLPIFPSLLT